MSNLPPLPTDSRTILRSKWLPELAQVFESEKHKLTLLAYLNISNDKRTLGDLNDDPLLWWERLIRVLNRHPDGIERLCKYARSMYPHNPVFSGQATVRRSISSSTNSTVDFTLPPGIPPDRVQALLKKMAALAASMNTTVTIEPDAAGEPPDPEPPEPPAPESPHPASPTAQQAPQVAMKSLIAPLVTPKPAPSLTEHGLTWLHVSDIHFGDLHKCTDYAKKNILDELIIDAKGTAARLGPPDFIFVTGDIAFRADLNGEYGKASEWLQALAKAVGCTASQILCVPGNHDINRREAVDGFTPRIIHQALRTEPAHFDEVMGDRKTMEILWAKFAAYSTFAERLGTPGISPETPWWCQTVESPVKPLIVVGLNTAVASFDNDDGPDNLLLGQRQLQKAVRDHPRDTLLVVLMHHPPEWLIDKDELVMALSKRPHILLCGHIHQESATQTKTLDGQQILRFNAGAAHSKGEFRAFGYTWGRLRGQDLTYYPRTWVKDTGEFTGDRNKYKTMDEHGAVLYPQNDVPQLLKNWMEGSPR